MSGTFYAQHGTLNVTGNGADGVMFALNGALYVLGLVFGILRQIPRKLARQGVKTLLVERHPCRTG